MCQCIGAFLVQVTRQKQAQIEQSTASVQQNKYTLEKKKKQTLPYDIVTQKPIKKRISSKKRGSMYTRWIGRVS